MRKWSLEWSCNWPKPTSWWGPELGFESCTVGSRARLIRSFAIPANLGLCEKILICLLKENKSRVITILFATVVTYGWKYYWLPRPVAGMLIVLSSAFLLLYICRYLCLKVKERQREKLKVSSTIFHSSITLLTHLSLKVSSGNGFIGPGTSSTTL